MVGLWALGHSKEEGKDVLMALGRMQKTQDARVMPPPLHHLDGATSISCKYFASLILPISGKVSLL